MPAQPGLDGWIDTPLRRWYFNSHGEFVDRDKKEPAPGPGGLAEYDPDGFRLLTAIYGGTDPRLNAVDPTARVLRPLASREGEGDFYIQGRCALLYFTFIIFGKA